MESITSRRRFLDYLTSMPARPPDPESPWSFQYVAGVHQFATAFLRRPRIPCHPACDIGRTPTLRSCRAAHQPKFDLREAIDGVTHARVLIHSSSPAEVDKVVAPATAIAAKTYQAGVEALAELNFRRKGLVVSLFLFCFWRFSFI